MTTPLRSRDSLALFWWVFAGALAANAFYIEIINDHFDRISRGQQILLGAVPFRDFFDPGWLFTIYSSAAALAIFGHRLLGEAILSGVFTAAGIAVAAVLVRAASNSRRAAIAAAVLLVIAQPRAYDYDKVFFYAVGLFACWSYAERPCRRSAIGLAVTAALAGLYRYDNGIYVIAAALVTLVAVHWGSGRLLIERITVFVGAGLVASLPAVLFVATHGGIPDAVRQIVDYATVESDRTHLVGWPRLVFDPDARWTLFTYGSAIALVYYPLLMLPILAAVSLLWQMRSGAPASRLVVARGLSAAVMCAIATRFVIRDPIAARYAAVAVPGVVLAGWLLRNATGPMRGTRRWARAAAAIAIGGSVAWAAMTLSVWVERVEQPLHEAAEQWSFLMSETPDDEWIYGYLSRCTAPADRVLVVDFQPQVPLFSNRGFAGGMLVFFGRHWTSPEVQQRITDRLQVESVPIVISRAPDQLEGWKTVADYVKREYSLAGQSAFGRNENEQFMVYAKRDFNRPMSRDVEWDLPCFK